MPLSASHIEQVLTSKDEAVKSILTNILILNIQHESTEKSIISTINKLISTAKSRREGLEYLSLIISRCSPAAISENALTWVSHCIIKYPDDVLRELKLRLLGEIIEASRNESDFNRQFSLNYLSKALDNCSTTSHVNPYECRTALHTLTILIKYYPSNWFVIHKNKIETFILIFLDNKNKDLVGDAALAFHYLQQVGGAGTNGQHHKTNFTNNFHKLLRTLHSQLNKYFEIGGFTFPDQNSNVEGNYFSLEDNLSKTSEVVLQELAQRIRNIFEFVLVLMKTGFPATKEINPKIVLNVLSKALLYHKCLTNKVDNVNEQLLENYQFSLLLQEIQCSALKSLELLIIWLQTNLLPFSYNISTLILESMEKSSFCDCYKFDSLYQESAYKALSQWISVSKSSFHPQFQTRLLEVILRDIKQKTAPITLTMSDGKLSEKKSAKAKRKAMINRIVSSGQGLTSKGSTDAFNQNLEITCRFALSSLKCLLEFTNLSIKPTQLKTLYKTIFDILINLQSGKLTSPYSNPRCQAKLYEVLVAVYNQKTLPVLPPLHTSLAVLNRGVNDRNRFVASICSEGLRRLEEFCQPICPSLYLSPEKESDQVDDETPKVVHETVGDEERVSGIYDETTEPNETDSEDRRSTGSDTATYHVRYTESDRSTIDDGLSDRGARNEEMHFEELEDDQQENKDGSDFLILEPPVVTAPSEDGNEILEGEYQDLDGLETIPEELEKEKDEVDEELNESQQGTNSESTQAGLADQTSDEKPVETLPQMSDEKSVETLPQMPDEKPVETLPQTSNKKTVETLPQTPSKEAVNNTETSELVDERAEIDCEEPESKKIKLTTEGDEASHLSAEEFGKDEEIDPDDAYLEDDSFVDQVKDY